MKVWISEDEVYPVFDLYDTDLDGLLEHEVDVPEKLINKYLDISVAYKELQRELYLIYKENVK
jgi:hypothetical protein